MEDLTEAMREASARLNKLIEIRASDGEFDEADIQATITNLHSIEDALECELDKIKTALEAARSHAADKTSERI